MATRFHHTYISSTGCLSQRGLVLTRDDLARTHFSWHHKCPVAGTGYFCTHLSIFSASPSQGPQRKARPVQRKGSVAIFRKTKSMPNPRIVWVNLRFFKNKHNKQHENKHPQQGKPQTKVSKTQENKRNKRNQENLKPNHKQNPLPSFKTKIHPKWLSNKRNPFSTATSTMASTSLTNGLASTVRTSMETRPLSDRRMFKSSPSTSSVWSLDFLRR